MKRVDLVFFDAGGGHRAAATALQQVITNQQRAWDVRMINLQELLDPLDIFRKITRIRLQDIYNLLLRKGWTLGSPQLMVAMHGVIRLYHRPTVRLLEKFWRKERPDLVVSVVPNFNRALGESLDRLQPRVPLVTVLTDLADYPPHFWIERQHQYLIGGTERAVSQARKMGHEPAHVFQTSGMILAPRFYETPEIDRRAERQKLGLDPDLPTGLVLFGGHGSRKILDIARRLDQSGLKLQLILICGKNQALVEELRKMPHRIPIFVEGFTAEVPHYMRLSDFFIGKPGPGSISEALALNLPVLVERNAWTLPQERYNADWVVEKQVGLVLRSFSYIVQAVEELLQPENYRRFREKAAAQQNRAVFEIPDILEKILESCDAPH
ncbi:MAG: Monogalactosyldiacylglycerol synthase [Bryobacterales bacterium]|nr:Monogalactosyldiacylglycerol synthase [Bryobacterales bacterium]